jgi:hypothetical protein
MIVGAVLFGAEMVAIDSKSRLRAGWKQQR